MRTILLFGICAALWADTYPRQPGIDVQHYVFRVTLSDDSDEIAGETTVTVRFVKDGVTQVALDLGSAMTVSQVGSNRFRHDGDRLLIDLNLAPKTGEMRQFSVKYRGKPSFGLKILRNRYSERCFFSSNWPDLAHHWLPTVDHPYDKATGEFIVTAPSHYQVVANGVLQETTDLPDGRRVTHWNQRVPIATWLYNIGVAQFNVRHFAAVGGIPLQTWVFHQDRNAGIGTFEDATRRAVEFFSSHVGTYPYEKLADVQSAGNAGAMEHASAIFYGERTVDGKPAYRLVAHETAHQWFGDSVTEKDWDDVWLSEGFATYFAALATEHYDGRDAFVAAMKRSRDQVYTTEAGMPGVAVVQERPWKGIPNAIVYQKGGWVLHLLRGQIGTEKFWAGIREYYRRYRDGSASTEDFRAVMEEISGEDLRWFFQQWVYRAGSPKIEGSWKYDPAAKRVELELAQTQGGVAYRLPLDVGVGAEIRRIEMTESRQRFEIPAERPPASVTLDPNTWMLIDIRAFTQKP